MSALEAAPQHETGEEREHAAFQKMLGEGVTLASGVKVEPFTRRWVSGCDKDRVVTQEEFYVGYSTESENGNVRHDMLVAKAPDELSLHRFSAQTQISWAEAQVWVVDSQQ